jgi:hypothetical protein
MNSMAFSLSPNSNLKIDGNQVTSEAVDFQPHPPTLTPIFVSLDQEMDLTIGSLNFHVGSMGTLRLPDLTRSGPSIEKNRICGNNRIIGWLFQRGKLVVIFKPTESIDTSQTYL